MYVANFIIKKLIKLIFSSTDN